MNDAAVRPLVRVLVVESQELLSDLLLLGLSRVGLSVRAAEDRSVEGVVALAQAYRPHVVLLHVSDGACVPMVEALTRVGAKVLILTGGTHDEDVPAECLEKGAVGLLGEELPLGELVDKIGDAALGRAVMPPWEREAVIQGLCQHRAAQKTRRRTFAALSAREREVLAHLMDGRAAEEIARDGYVSLATVRTHIRSILQKLGVNSQLAAVVLAQKCQWTSEMSDIA